MKPGTQIKLAMWLFPAIKKWVHINKVILTDLERENILMRKMIVNDTHMNEKELTRLLRRPKNV